MALLDTQFNFRSLSLKDLLEARDLYHWHLLNKENVVGTAVGLYLIRDEEHAERGDKGHGRRHKPAGPRRFDNASVQDYSWPCVLVLVRDWLESHQFTQRPGDFIPPTLYLPDGRRVPVCVVAVEPAEAAPLPPAPIRFPESYVGGGFPLVAEVQEQEHFASAGCLVSDGHRLYALTNRHVCGEPGTPIHARVRGQDVEIGEASPLQLTRLPFTEVYPEFPGQRTYLTLDIGLVDVHDANDWRSAVYGLGEPGPVADFNELNIGLQLIDQPVCAFGAASGLLSGRIKALFYRYKAQAGYDYVSDFLIAPEGGNQTRHGDSGTVWHLGTPPSPKEPAPAGLRPVAVEWGGQALAERTGKYNFALATCLSTVCRILDVDLVRQHNDGAQPYWGQTGHYGIAAAAIDAVQDPALHKLLDANRGCISFTPNQLTPDQIKQALSQGDFVELADVPDLVWKRTKDTPGGRDYAKNSGPEHPNHYADIDKPDAGGQILRTLCLGDAGKLDPQAWIAFYNSVGETDSAHVGLLPFRVWQIFETMVAALQAGDLDRFVCAAGVIAHYVGDACQPLHGSYLSNGYQDRPVPSSGKSKKWQGQGVHSTYEDKMVDRFSTELLQALDAAVKQPPAAGQAPPAIRTGKDAALATLKLMDVAAGIIAPSALCDAYIKLGGGTSKPVVQGLWDQFGSDTAKVMIAGARYLAAIWDAAYAASGASLHDTSERDKAKLAAIYQDAAGFCPSLTLDKIGSVLGQGGGGGGGGGSSTAAARNTAAKKAVAKKAVAKKAPAKKAAAKKAPAKKAAAKKKHH